MKFKRRYLKRLVCNSLRWSYNIAVILLCWKRVNPIMLNWISTYDRICSEVINYLVDMLSRLHWNKNQCIDSCYYSYQQFWHVSEVIGSFSIVLTHKSWSSFDEKRALAAGSSVITAIQLGFKPRFKQSSGREQHDRICNVVNPKGLFQCLLSFDCHY